MKTILIDDEQLALHYLEHQLTGINGMQILGKFTDPDAGAQAARAEEVELVFLDIQMPEINGIQLAEQLLEERPELHIVFVTAYEEYAVKAFEINALDYVLKPVSKKRLQQTVSRIRSRRVRGAELMTDDRKTLRLNLFLQPTLIPEGGRELSLNWRTTKAEQLFLYLVQYRQTDVQKDTLTELFWPDLEHRKAAHQLYTAIYHIRKTLNPFQAHFNVQSISGGYRLTLNRVSLDVEEFECLLKANKQVNEGNIKDYERALSLVKGDYLAEHDSLWCEAERQRLRLLWLQTGVRVVGWYFGRRELEKTINLGLTLCQRYPYEEEVYFYLMQAFALQNKCSLVERTYAQLQERLLEGLGEHPNEQINCWYHRWQRSREA